MSAAPTPRPLHWLGTIGMWALSVRLAFAGVSTAVVAVTPGPGPNGTPAPRQALANNVLKNLAQVTSRLVDATAGLETALPVDDSEDGSRYWTVDTGWSTGRILEACSDGGAQQALLLTLSSPADGDNTTGGFELQLRRVHKRGLDEPLGVVEIPPLAPGTSGITREQFEGLEVALSTLVEHAAEAPGQINVQCTDSMSGQRISCACDLDGVGFEEGDRCVFKTISGSYNLSIGGGDAYAPTARRVDIGEGEVVNVDAPLDQMASLTVQAPMSARVWVDQISVTPRQAIPVRPYVSHSVELRRGHRQGMKSVSLDPGQVQTVRVPTTAGP